jgi:hypothetical protein
MLKSGKTTIHIGKTKQTLDKREKKAQFWPNTWKADNALFWVSVRVFPKETSPEC